MLGDWVTAELPGWLEPSGKEDQKTWSFLLPIWPLSPSFVPGLCYWLSGWFWPPFSHFKPQFLQLENGGGITPWWRRSKMTCVKATVALAVAQFSLWGHMGVHFCLLSCPTKACCPQARPYHAVSSGLSPTFLPPFLYQDLPTLHPVSSGLNFLLTRIKWFLLMHQ